MLIPTGFAQVNLKHVVLGSEHPAEVTLGINNSGAAGTLIEQAEIIRDAWQEWWVASMATALFFTGVRIKEGPNATGAAVEIAATGQGGGTAGACPPNVAVLVHKLTPYGGRTGRGRMYLPGIPEENVDSGGNISSSWLADRQSNLNSFWAELVAADLDPVLLHSEETAVSDPFVITSFAVQSKVATQRRRLRR